MSAYGFGQLDSRRFAVTILRPLLRLYSYAFQALFAVVALGMAVISLASGPQTINFDLLPWDGGARVYALIGLALIGVLILLMAVRGKMQMLFLAWSLLALGLVVRLFFFTPFTYYRGASEFMVVLGIVLAAALAVLGAGMKPATSSR
jgi:hypothetical protein